MLLLLLLLLFKRLFSTLVGVVEIDPVRFGAEIEFATGVAARLALDSVLKCEVEDVGELDACVVEAVLAGVATEVVELEAPDWVA